jgi:branched-chain amino acid transport system ATP-binding protein
MTDVLLSANDLSVRFGGVLGQQGELRRAPGEVFTLIGPNGAGKTTVFNLISRIYHAHDGRSVRGSRLTTEPPHAMRLWALRAPSRTSSCSSTPPCCTTC